MSSGSPPRSDTYQAVQPQNMIRCFKKERDCTIEEAKTKALISNQLCSYRAADRCLCFSHMYAKARFSHDVAHLLIFVFRCIRVSI